MIERAKNRKFFVRIIRRNTRQNEHKKIYFITSVFKMLNVLTAKNLFYSFIVMHMKMRL